MKPAASHGHHVDNQLSQSTGLFVRQLESWSETYIRLELYTTAQLPREDYWQLDSAYGRNDFLNRVDFAHSKGTFLLSEYY